MKLNIRYDCTVQSIELDEIATEQLWVSLSLEGEDLTQKEREQMIQDAFEEQFNRPEYNNWHKFYRHHGYTVATSDNDEETDDDDSFEPLLDEVVDDCVFRRDELERDLRENYEAVCLWVGEVLAKKPEWAEAFIAVRLNGESIREYAARKGADENNVTQKLKRAQKKLKENYQNRQI